MSDDRGDRPDPVLAAIGTALFHLRRVWIKPDMMKRIRARTTGGPGGRPLQISNLMVVNAVAALTDEPPAERPVAPSGDAVDAADAGGTGGEAGEAEVSCEITVGAVADRLEIDPSTASRLVGHAIDAGLVSRRPSPVDARRANLGLTDAGRRVKQVADRYRRAYYHGLMNDWTDAERAEFARLLTRFADAAARDPMDPDGIDKIFEEAGLD
ncbi:MarR family winged helix-turn-helix transcriptional regulator [Actinomadura nitritigenes]|uniref:MarR family winged helix-turn-helix transcriptional regulator n=1 Tax=Actinomadura nitritigenes TaxID=134602 RepID=UPI003D8A45B5